LPQYSPAAAAAAASAAAAAAAEVHQQRTWLHCTCLKAVQAHQLSKSWKAVVSQLSKFCCVTRFVM
jgi:hypothetical protein